NNLITQAKVLKNENSNEDINAQVIISDENFAQTYQIPLLAGRFFGRPMFENTDLTEVVINKNASQLMGYNTPQDALGDQITIQDGKEKAIISGVTEDFIANSMHSP